MQRHELLTIPAGRFWVGSRSDCQLEAFLGTCVGLGVYDRETQAGGLIHLLLPEPPLPESTFQLEKYATTGLPLFLAALRDEGAEVHRMRTCLAGGALIGPLATKDLNLDIGGRTCENVLAFLHREGIPIDRLETGGFLPTRIGLDMRNGQFAIDPAGGRPMANAGQLSAPSKDDICQALKGLQPIPQMALRILRLVADADYPVQELAQLVRQDQVICARTLKLCNAAAFSGQGRIASIEHALAFLGQDRFIHSVITVCVRDFFRQPGQGDSVRLGGMYQHAVGTAQVAEQLAQRTRTLTPALAYTAGLLHDIGKVVLDQFVAPRRPLFYRDIADAIDFLSVEARHLSIDHTQAGRWLAEDWGLPAPFRETITHHHGPEKAADHVDLVHLVYVADLIMSAFHTGCDLERVDTGDLGQRLGRVGLSLRDLPKIVDSLPETIFKPVPAGSANM